MLSSAASFAITTSNTSLQISRRQFFPGDPLVFAAEVLILQS